MGSKVYHKTPAEIEFCRESSLLVCKTLSELAAHIKPGVQTIHLDKVAYDFIHDHNAVPGFLNYEGFPYSLCISVNDAVVHGFPSKYELKESDIVSIDCGVLMNDFYGDSAYTYAVGEVSEEVERLMKVTMECLDLGIEQAVVGRRIGDISYAVQNHAEKVNGYGVVRELVGHGVGKMLHEDPQVPNFGKRGRGSKLKEGLVIAIEPMINMGTKDVTKWDDGWTIATEDGLPSAHFEKMVVVRKGKADILTDYGMIEEAVKKNMELSASY